MAYGNPRELRLSRELIKPGSGQGAVPPFGKLEKPSYRGRCSSSAPGMEGLIGVRFLPVGAPPGSGPLTSPDHGLNVPCVEARFPGMTRGNHFRWQHLEPAWVVEEGWRLDVFSGLCPGADLGSGRLFTSTALSGATGWLPLDVEGVR